jgi:hypothetical protein
MRQTVKQYADSIGKSKMTVYRWIKDKKLPSGVKAEMCCGNLIINVKGK